jgi:hypothetical protein
MTHLIAFAHAHIEFLSMFALAVVVTMRDELPPPFNRVPILAWFYGWIHDALKAFVNALSGPKKTQP